MDLKGDSAVAAPEKIQLNFSENLTVKFSGAKLKYIAFASMLIDHFNKAIIYPNLDGGLFIE